MTTEQNTSNIKVYVLTVKSFKDRILHIENEMLKHGIKFEFILDHDIPDLDKEIVNKTFEEETTLSLAQKSLVLKHIAAWKSARKNNIQQILIFEDDVILHRKFNSILNSILKKSKAIESGYLIFLGGADAKVPDSYLLSKDILVELPIATTEAYITDISAINLRLNWLENNKVSLPADHFICKVDKQLNIKNFWSRTPIVEQGSVTGIFDSKLDKHRQKHSITFNVLRYHWNKYQRHTLRRFAAIIKQGIKKQP
jgi:glycosyl transferase family 25